MRLGALFGLAFATAPRSPRLTSPHRRNSPAHYAKGTRSGLPSRDGIALPPLVGRRFQVLFHSPRRGSFHLSLTVLLRYRSSTVFSLGKWSSRFPAGFHVSCGTQVSRQQFFPRIRGSHPLWPAFPRRSPSASLPYTRPYNPDPKTGLGSSAFARHY